MFAILKLIKSHNNGGRLCFCVVSLALILAMQVNRGQGLSKEFFILFLTLNFLFLSVVVSFLKLLEKRAAERVLASALRPELTVEQARRAVLEQIDELRIKEASSETVDRRLTGQTAEFFSLFSEVVGPLGDVVGVSYVADSFTLDGGVRIGISSVSGEFVTRPGQDCVWELDGPPTAGDLKLKRFPTIWHCVHSFFDGAG